MLLLNAVVNKLSETFKAHQNSNGVSFTCFNPLELFYHFSLLKNDGFILLYLVENQIHGECLASIRDIIKY